jgi:hypothetical protein
MLTMVAHQLMQMAVQIAMVICVMLTLGLLHTMAPVTIIVIKRWYFAQLLIMPLGLN